MEPASRGAILIVERPAGVLYKRLEKLKERPNIEGQLVDDFLHEARLLGNDSLHDGTVFSAEEVMDVAQLIVEAVTVLYVQPEQRRKMRDARRARSRKPATPPA